MDRSIARDEQWARFRQDKGDYLLGPDKSGNTALHIAAKLGLEHVATDLIAQGQDINAQNVYGEAPLHSAINPLFQPAGDERAIQQALLDAGADVSVKTTTGSTLLHAAALEGDSPMCEYLIDRRGLDVNAKDMSGDTPLHEAAWSGGEAVDALIERGADLSARNAKGRNARDVAQGPASQKLDQAMQSQVADKRLDIPSPKAAMERLRNAPVPEATLVKGRAL